MDAADFLYHENPPTWTGVEPSTLGVQGASDKPTTLPNRRNFESDYSDILDDKSDEIESDNERIIFYYTFRIHSQVTRTSLSVVFVTPKMSTPYQWEDFEPRQM
ncbi:hypothetical protein TNCV_312541 [Trichonephila clavipes]|nr:hypothetical protein TNCV_312541 [Trichonephila clavipes]